jgi:membrane protease YdiL (CAAX protease family)
MRLLSLIRPPFDARIDVGWDERHVAAGLVAGLAMIMATQAPLLALLDEPVPLWVVLGLTLGLDIGVATIAACLGPGRVRALISLMGPRQLPILPRFSWGALALGGSLIGLELYVALMSNVSRDLVPPPLPESIGKAGLRWLTFIVVVLVGPFAEELFFRGFVFAGLLRRFGLPAAVVISSALFAAAHMDMAVAGPAFLAGSVFALVYWRTGTLWPVILAHTVQNAIAFTLSQQ